MEQQRIITAIEAALTEALERPISGLTEADLLVDDLGMDSISMLEALMGLEDELGIELGTDSLDIGDFRSVGTLVEFVRRQQAPGSVTS